MNKLSSHISFWILVLHFICSSMYLLMNEYGGFKEYDLAVMYFGLEAFFCGTSIYNASNCKIWIARQFHHIHSFFILFRGLVYILHYSDIYTSTNLELLVWYCLYSIVAVGVFHHKCLKHGYYNEI